MGFPRRLGRWMWIEGLSMALAPVVCLAALAAEYQGGIEPARTLPGVTLLGADVGGLPAPVVGSLAVGLAVESLGRPIDLVAPGVVIQTTAMALGATLSVDVGIDRAMHLGRSGQPLDDLRDRVAIAEGRADIVVADGFDPTIALERLTAIAPLVQRPSLPRRLDLEARKVVPADPGT